MGNKHKNQSKSDNDNSESNQSVWQQITTKNKHYRPQYGKFKIFKNKQTAQEYEKYNLVLHDKEQYQEFQEYIHWRNKSPYLVKVQTYQQESKKQICASQYKINMFIERIPLRLSDLTDIPFPQNLYFLVNVLKGFKYIFTIPYAIRNFQVMQHMICVTNEGKVKVWMNPDLSSSHPIPSPQKQQYYTQEEVLLNLLNMIQDNTDYKYGNPYSFRRYLNDKRIRISGDFNAIIQQVYCFAQDFRVKIPNEAYSVKDVIQRDKAQNTQQNDQYQAQEQNNNSSVLHRASSDDDRRTHQTNEPFMGNHRNQINRQNENPNVNTNANNQGVAQIKQNHYYQIQPTHNYNINNAQKKQLNGQMRNYYSEDKSFPSDKFANHHLRSTKHEQQNHQNTMQLNEYHRQKLSHQQQKVPTNTNTAVQSHNLFSGFKPEPVTLQHNNSNNAENFPFTRKDPNSAVEMQMKFKNQNQHQNQHQHQNNLIKNNSFIIKNQQRIPPGYEMRVVRRLVHLPNQQGNRPQQQILPQQIHYQKQNSQEKDIYNRNQQYQSYNSNPQTQRSQSQQQHNNFLRQYQHTNGIPFVQSVLHHQSQHQPIHIINTKNNSNIQQSPTNPNEISTTMKVERRKVAQKQPDFSQEQFKSQILNYVLSSKNNKSNRNSEENNNNVSSNYFNSNSISSSRNQFVDGANSNKTNNNNTTLKFYSQKNSQQTLDPQIAADLLKFITAA